MSSSNEEENDDILPLKRGRPTKLSANARWSEYKTEDLKLLIGLVYENDILWDSRNSQNYRKETTNPIWHSIEKNLNFIKNNGHQYGGTVRKLWAELVSKFKYYHKKVNCPPSGSGVVDMREIKKSFPLYDDMMFLEQNFVQRSVTTTWLSSSPLNDSKSTSVFGGSKDHVISPNSPTTPAAGTSTPRATAPRKVYRSTENKKKESAQDKLFALVERNSEQSSELIKKFLESENIESSQQKEAKAPDPLMDTINMLKNIHDELDDYEKINFRAKLTIAAIEIRDEMQAKKEKRRYHDPLLGDLNFNF